MNSPPSLRRVIVPMPSSFTEVQISYPQLEQEPQCESNDVSETVQGLPHKGEIMSVIRLKFQPINHLVDQINYIFILDYCEMIQNYG